MPAFFHITFTLHPNKNGGGKFHRRLLYFPLYLPRAGILVIAAAAAKYHYDQDNPEQPVVIFTATVEKAAHTRTSFPTFKALRLLPRARFVIP